MRTVKVLLSSGLVREACFLVSPTIGRTFSSKGAPKGIKSTKKECPEFVYIARTTAGESRDLSTMVTSVRYEKPSCVMIQLYRTTRRGDGEGENAEGTDCEASGDSAVQADP
jgi:hypothetical protein